MKMHTFINFRPGRPFDYGRPEATTLALGEEGGHGPSQDGMMSTMAWGEEGGHTGLQPVLRRRPRMHLGMPPNVGFNVSWFKPRPPMDHQVSTRALGEEGGNGSYTPGWGSGYCDDCDSFDIPPNGNTGIVPPWLRGGPSRGGVTTMALGEEGGFTVDFPIPTDIGGGPVGSPRGGRANLLSLLRELLSRA